MKALLLLSIRFYQRFISPYKGYGCACRVHTGRASCSALGYRAIRRYGAWRGFLILQQRLRRCGDVHRQHIARHPRMAQAGFCDPDLFDVVTTCDYCNVGFFPGLVDVFVGSSRPDSEGSEDESGAERTGDGKESCDAAIFKSLLLIFGMLMFLVWHFRNDLSMGTLTKLEIGLGLGVVLSWMVARRVS